MEDTVEPSYLPGINSLFIMCIGIITNNSFVGGRAQTEARTSTTERLTLYCRWPSNLPRGHMGRSLVRVAWPFWILPQSYLWNWRSCSVLFFSWSGSEGWPYHGCTFSVYVCLLSSWLTHPRVVLSTYWRCASRPCVAFLTCVHPALFFALSLSPGNSLVPHSVTIVC